MKPLREHVAIAIDGGGIKGVMVARALEIQASRAPSS